jgi:hypothetical protein
MKPAKIERTATLSRTARLLSLLFIALLGFGCAHTQDASQPLPPQQVVGLPNPEVAALTADDVVQVMWAAGMSEAQIMSLGRELRNTLARRGAAYIRIGRYVELVLAVRNDLLHITSRSRGSFIYDLKEHQFK